MFPEEQLTLCRVGARGDSRAPQNLYTQADPPYRGLTWVYKLGQGPERSVVMTKGLPPEVLHQLAALSWIVGLCSNCPSAYQPTDGLVTEVEDEQHPSDPPARYCRRCLTVRLVLDVERPAVMEAISRAAIQEHGLRLKQACRERAATVTSAVR
jgi:hypothetical protein